MKKDDPSFKGSREEIATLASLLSWDQVYDIKDLDIPDVADSALTFKPRTFLPPVDLAGRFMCGNEVCACNTLTNQTEAKLTFRIS